jgi:hypothetical protein
VLYSVFLAACPYIGPIWLPDLFFSQRAYHRWFYHLFISLLYASKPYIGLLREMVYHFYIRIYTCFTPVYSVQRHAHSGHEVVYVGSRASRICSIIRSFGYCELKKGCLPCFARVWGPYNLYGVIFSYMEPI